MMFSQELFVLFAVVLLFMVNAQVANLMKYDDFKDSLKKPAQSPGLMFEPSNPSEDGLIRYIMPVMNSYTKYTDRLQNMEERYDVATENMIDCSHIRSYRPPELWSKTCRFDMQQEISNVSSCSKFSYYGFDDGLPCIALTLNRGLNWLPKPYNNESVPDVVRDRWTTYSIPVNCVGEDPVSKDNIYSISYYPKEGFHFKYFPRTGQSEWLSPVVFISVMPNTGIVVRVTCTAYASNIDKNIAKVAFDLMID